MLENIGMKVKLSKKYISSAIELRATPAKNTFSKKNSINYCFLYMFLNFLFWNYL